MESNLSFEHQFIPAKNIDTARTLLMLHGTGGDENDLLPLGSQIDPSANLLSPRGQVNENGMLRFFKRFEDGTYDIEDLQKRTQELADFITEAASEYDFDPKKVTAVGFSNGANITASLLLLRPEVLGEAVLLRGGLPFEPEAFWDLDGKPVLVIGGDKDHMMSRASTEQLIEVLEEADAIVTAVWLPTGHGLTDDDVREAQQFLNSL